MAFGEADVKTPCPLLVREPLRQPRIGEAVAGAAWARTGAKQVATRSNRSDSLYSSFILVAAFNSSAVGGSCAARMISNTVRVSLNPCAPGNRRFSERLTIASSPRGSSTRRSKLS